MLTIIDSVLMFLGGILLSFWHVVMVLNNFLMILSGLLSHLDDILVVSWECLMNNSGRSLLRAEWSRTAKKLTLGCSAHFLFKFVKVGQGPKFFGLTANLMYMYIK